MRAASPAGGLSRRGAIAALASALSAPALAGLRSDPDFDVLIVGAGPAGIAAGRRLAGSKWKFGILEASDRRGGRCFTDTTTFGLPYDQGACRMHLPSRSSLAAQAARNEIDLYPDPEVLQFRTARPQVLRAGPGRRSLQDRAGAVLRRSCALLRRDRQRGGRQGRCLVYGCLARRSWRLAQDDGVFSRALPLRRRVEGAFRQGIRRFRRPRAGCALPARCRHAHRQARARPADKILQSGEFDRLGRPVGRARDCKRHLERAR
jgi:hypothetical protein